MDDIQKMCYEFKNAFSVCKFGVRVNKNTGNRKRSCTERRSVWKPRSSSVHRSSKFMGKKYINLALQDDKFC